MEKITSVQFRNFKALRNYSVSFDRMNILVGPNNSGKSTVIGAFRMLEAGLRSARTRRPEPIYRNGPLGYRIPCDSIPISLENAVTDYQQIEASVTFRLSNKNSLVLTFPPDDQDCFLVPQLDDRFVRNAKSFKAEFPIDIATVPILGPVEHDEGIIQWQTVRSNLATHRASRNFRNYWRYNEEEFESFRQLVRDTWIGVDIKPPEILGNGTSLAMFSEENRMLRELYWTGFGFQVWCHDLTPGNSSTGK